MIFGHLRLAQDECMNKSMTWRYIFFEHQSRWFCYSTQNHNDWRDVR